MKYRIVKITLVIADLGAGGAERVLSILANKWCEKGHKINIVLLSEGPSFYKLDSRIKVTELGFLKNRNNYSRAISIFKVARKLRKHIKEIHPDFILSFMNKYNIFVLLSLFKTKNKIYVSERDSPTEKLSYLTVFLRNFSYRYASGIICQTKLSKEFIEITSKNDNVTTIANPISDCVIDNKIKKENIILNVGRMVEKKGQKYLIEAFANIQHKNWNLYFVGNGPLKRELENYAKELGLSDRVFFLGQQKDVAYWYQKAKIFAFPSILEGFPNALAEAMSYGLACVSFDCYTGPSDIINNGYNGYLVEERNVAEFTNKINYLVENENEIHRFSENANQIRSLLNKDRISEMYFNFCTAN